MIRILGTIFAGLFGLAFGSFLNVCLSRWPAGESVVKPRSHCRQCNRTLTWWENVPLVSWLALARPLPHLPRLDRLALSAGGAGGGGACGPILMDVSFAGPGLFASRVAASRLYLADSRVGTMIFSLGS